VRDEVLLEVSNVEALLIDLHGISTVELEKSSQSGYVCVRGSCFQKLRMPKCDWVLENHLTISAE
jgi:hypothetical protein